MNFIIKPMRPSHYQQVYALWNSIEGMDLHAVDDNPTAIAAFLDFNPDLNYIAEADGKVVGVVMCGFDGRRATIYHAAVATAYRGCGIATALLERVEKVLKAKKITKGRLLAFKSNEAAAVFWQKAGWTLHNRFNYFSKSLL